jgi:hypothetical protein
VAAYISRILRIGLGPIAIGALPGGRGRLRWLQAVLCLVTFVNSAAAGAQHPIDVQRQNNVKVATLYAFARYVTWPQTAFASATSPFVIGVLGPNPFRAGLNVIAAKKAINGRPIVILELQTPEQGSQCHIVFVTRAVARSDEARLFQEVAGRPIVVVGETPRFNERGGIANFFQSGPNVRFELNAQRGMDNQLSFDATLLALNAKPTQSP